MASLSLKNVCKVYPNGFEAVKDFNLEVEDQEFIIFVGPSGRNLFKTCDHTKCSRFTTSGWSYENNKRFVFNL